MTKNLDGVVAQPGPQDMFTDWYIPADEPAKGWVHPGRVGIGTSPELVMIANELADLCAEKDSEEFVVKASGRVFRGHRIETVEGVIFSLRKMPQTIPEFARLGLDPGVQKLMLSPKLSTGGLVIIAGETGQGKSTTCASFLKARMSMFGSFCLTLENPPELPLHGFHGDAPGETPGVCVQTDVRSGRFGDALRGAMRCYPTQGNSILFVGEVRDPETAGEALRVAVNGHLVVTTLHGGEIISSMKRFLSLAAAYSGMGESEARSVLSSAFRLMVLQRLDARDRSPGAVKKLSASVLFSPGQVGAVANRIRDGQLDQLSTEINAQANLLSLNQVDKLLSMWEMPSAQRRG